MTRKICAITGTRSEYGLLKPVMSEIIEQGMELSLIVTGMHLSHEFGYTVREIEDDKFKVDYKVDMLVSGDSPAAMAKSVGLGILGITQALEADKPDIVLVLGDRIEALAAAISAAHLGIPIAHIAGGDTASGSNIDDSIRHVITKFSHIHFPATERHAERIIKLGEDPRKVFTVGSTGLDSILNEKLIEPQKIADDFNLDLKKPILLVVQHPTTVDWEKSGDYMRNTLEAIVEIGEQTIVIYPNADAGGQKIIEIIKDYERFPFIKTYKNLIHNVYLSLMNISTVIVGNSSSGVIEAPSFNLPAVNIGPRQKGREHAENVINTGYQKSEISEAIKKALYDPVFRDAVKGGINPYGEGNASRRIAGILEEIPINKTLLQKTITY